MRVRDDQKVQKIRKLAIKMMVKHGLDGFSMQKLAKEAGVSPATLYIYYKDREDLIISLWTDVFGEMTEATLKNFEPAMSFRDGLTIQWKNRARFCLDNPEYMQFIEQLRHSQLHDKAHGNMSSSLRQSMQSFVANAIRKGELVNVPVEVYWSIAFAPLYSLVKFQLEGKNMAGGKFSLTRKTMNDALQLVLKALTP